MGRGPKAQISFTYCMARLGLKAGGVSGTVWVAGGVGFAAGGAPWAQAMSVRQAKSVGKVFILVGLASIREVPQGLKPCPPWQLYAGLEGLLHPTPLVQINHR